MNKAEEKQIELNVKVSYTYVPRDPSEPLDKASQTIEALNLAIKPNFISVYDGVQIHKVEVTSTEGDSFTMTQKGTSITE